MPEHSVTAEELQAVMALQIASRPWRPGNPIVLRNHSLTYGLINCLDKVQGSSIQSPTVVLPRHQPDHKEFICLQWAKLGIHKTYQWLREVLL